MSWKMKLSCELLHFRIKILMILIVNVVTKQEAGNLGWIHHAADNHSIFMQDDKSAQLINNIATNNYDPDYPYEKLLELVKETKRILTSSNATAEKEMLKLEPIDYVTYLRSNDLHDQLHRPSTPIYPPDFRISLQNGAPPLYPSYMSPSPATVTCDAVQLVGKPTRLRSIDGSDQFVINVGKEFVQEWRTIHCFRPDELCGNPKTWPEMYETVCEQNYSGTTKFFSVPVGQEITLSQQKLREFKIPDGCNCKLRLAARKH